MIALRDFFEKLRQINDGKRGGDKIKISNSKGEPINLEKEGNAFSIDKEKIETAEQFLNLLGDLTGWEYLPEKWNFKEFTLYKFSKGNITPSNRRFNELIDKNPMSWAMTSTLAIEYTLEEPNKLP